MNTTKSNPFKELELNVSQKAVFQPFSHEAKSFDNNKSLDLLTFLVIKGYDLHTIVLEYLEDKVSLDDRSRISEIESAFNYYHSKISLHNISKSKWCSANMMKEIIEDYTECLLVNGYDFLGNSGDLANFYKRMTEQVEGFVKTVRTRNIPTSLSIRKLITAFVEDDKKAYEYLSKLWQIDLEKDLTEEIQKREKDNNDTHWNQKSLYALVKDTFLNNLKTNQIPIYLAPVYDCPSTQYYNTLLKKFYPIEEHEFLKSDKYFRRERMLDYAEKVIEILWLNKPYFDEPIYFTRCNFPIGDIANQYIPELFERNLISICIKDNEETDLSLYGDLLNGKEVKYNFSLNYIHRFLDIAHIVNDKDVLVISSYLGKYENKIGLIKKGSKIIELKKEKLTLYCLQMKSVYCTPYPNFWGETNEIKTLNLSSYPILKSLIPQHVAISPVQKNKNKIYSIYYGCPIKIELDSMSNESIETMCTEWLRSKYAPEGFKIKFQLIRTGGNFADIDIIGCNSNNEKIACQVTNTENEKLIKDKTKKLESFDSDKKVMFSRLKTHMKPEEVFNQNIMEIWNSFKNDSIYVKLLERLIMS